MSGDTGGPGMRRRLGNLGERPWLVPALAGLAGLVLVLLLAGIVALILANRGGEGDAAAGATVTPSGTAIVIAGSASATGTARAAGTTGAAGTTAPGAAGTRTTAATGATTARVTTATGAQTTAAAPPPASGANKVFVVSGTNNEGVRLRGAPGTSGNQIAVLPEGARLEQIGPDREVGGVTWRNVRTPEGQEGWVAAEFTSEAP